MSRSGRQGLAELVRVVRATGIRDQRVLEAIAHVPRAEFVPANAVGGAYFDDPISIGHGQVTTQPSLVARMVEALSLSGTERALEIGTGLGWQTALLATLADRVWSVERFADLAEAARLNLARLGILNAKVLVADGFDGVSEDAPYEAIVVAAASPEVPPALADQLTDGGRLVHPVGSGGDEQVILFEKQAGELRARRSLTRARFVKLVSPGR
jgi:protein-L-isoaspartate(D-aspartate) O-methyltransferase